MSLAVARLRTTIHSPRPVADERCAEWVSAFAAQDGEALGAGLVQDGEWLLIRRVRVTTRWRVDEVGVDAGRLWGQALRRSIEEAIAHDDGGNCVRYANRGAAIADLIYRSACGERTRQWAWQRMRLIDRADTDCVAVLESGVRRLLSEPEWVWPVVGRIVAAEERTGSLTAMLRALPLPLWSRLFAICPQTARYVSSGSAAMSREQPDDAEPADSADIAASAPARALVAWARTRSYFVERHIDVLSVLLAALVWPGPGHAGEGSRRRVRLVRTQLVTASMRAAVAHRAAPSMPPAVESAGQVLPAPIVERGGQHNPDDTPSSPPELARELPALPDSATWLQTEWGGALFWLGRMAASGAFNELGFQRDAPGDDLRFLLYAVARALGVPDGDSALVAFCGGSLPRGEVPPHITTYADVLVARWRAWLADVAPDLPEPRLTTVCRRSGRLRVEPGWVELHLPMTAVATAIRRIGLDLDPGWLPWLGCVVRICYDE